MFFPDIPGGNYDKPGPLRGIEREYFQRGMGPAIGEQILRGTHRLEPMPGGETTSLLSQRFLAGDEETLLFLFLEILRRVNKSTPSTPSGMIPPRLKASAQTREANPPE